MAPKLGSQVEKVLCEPKMPYYFLVLRLTVVQYERLEQTVFFICDEVLIEHDSDQNQALGQRVIKLLKAREPFIFRYGFDLQQIQALIKVLCLIPPCINSLYEHLWSKFIFERYYLFD